MATMRMTGFRLAMVIAAAVVFGSGRLTLGAVPLPGPATQPAGQSAGSRPAGRPAAPAKPTELGKLAASMKPGTWAELPTKNMTETLKANGASGGIMGGYHEDAAWDPTSRQLLFISGDHNWSVNTTQFACYSADENAWKLLPRPAWAGILHGYDHNAIDAATGTFYHRPYNGKGTVHKYDIATGKWSTLPELQTGEYMAVAIGVEFFPELNGLVLANGGGGKGSVFLFSEKDQKWSTLATGLPMGNYHNFAEYSPMHKVMIFGGGQGSRDLYKLDAAGKVTTQNKAPVGLGVYSDSIVTCDPVGGDFLIFTAKGQFYVYDVRTDTWKLQDGPAPPFTKPTRSNAIWQVIACPIDTYGVVLFAKYYFADPPKSWVYLYKHSAAGSARPAAPTGPSTTQPADAGR